MKAKPFIQNGIVMIILFIVMHISITAHFGWNKFPIEAVEAVMDMTCIMGMLTGCVLVTIGQSLKG